MSLNENRIAPVKRIQAITILENERTTQIEWSYITSYEYQLYAKKPVTAHHTAPGLLISASEPSNHQQNHPFQTMTCRESGHFAKIPP